MKKENALLLISFILLGLLGLSIGLSVASFCIAINNNDTILYILSYFTLLLFTLILVILIFIYFRNLEMFKSIVRKKGENNEKE